ncbi:MBL fold metallo-hydrolase [Actinotalea sp. M2MS4P-6]|uniref:MBL fold metallo-hydrolase n=1 Tax=Actinotalea sp. M2MS4P-6 TaxID=2983762 RepID=UPI0021E4A07C|nr:MBL fold metallo-hydrolase [Actinotalea sp. M2MS4P-6]MCV2394540.1 MBL fold metallo-hydrolase [Actinotalea sp. M2MS4P-6]
MLLRTVEAPLLGATCVLLVDEAGGVVVVDAGGGVADRVTRMVAAEGWNPVAVLATHGHVDHTWDAGLLCQRWGVPLHIHEADTYRLADPFGSLGPLGPQLRAMAGLPDPQDPPRVATSPAEPWVTAPLDLPWDGAIGALPLPGHTEGSTAYRVEVDGAAVLLTGDVLFAGSIGRTDLPGGDDATMARSLRLLAREDPLTQVVPGHGPRTTIGAELRTNPYLRAAR